MKEQFYTEIITGLFGKIPDECLETVRKILVMTGDDYEIERKSTDIVLYDPFPQYAKMYLVSRKIEGLSEKTLSLYAYDIRRFCQFVQKPLDEVTPNDVRLFLYSQNSVSDRTLDSMRTIVCTFLKWLNTENYIPTNPGANIKPIKYERKKRSYLSEMETETVRNVLTNLRDKALFEFLYSTGCRASEAAGVKIADVDFIEGTVHLFGKGKKHRTSYLNAKAKIAIQNYLNSRDDDCEYLFVSERRPFRGLSYDAVYRSVKLWSKKANLNKNLFPHLIRHTTATHGLQRGMDVTELQELLGHNNISTTMIYASLSDAAVKTAHGKCIV